MNIGKIEELAKKIYGINITKNPLGNPMYEFTGTELAMFAELIVRECAKVCSEVEDTYGNLNKIDIAVGAGVCVSEIKEHFGVEE